MTCVTCWGPAGLWSGAGDFLRRVDVPGVGHGHRAHEPGVERHDFFGCRRTSTTTSTCPSANVIPFALCWGRPQQAGGVATSSLRPSSSVVRLHPRRHDISRHFPLFFLSFLLLFPSFFLCVQHTNTNALAHGFVGTADLLVGGGFDSHQPPQKP